MAIKYKKNPATYSQPDLFTSFGDTPNFVPMGELTEDQLKALPRSAYQDDEWEELDDDTRVHILLEGSTVPKDTAKRLDFTDDDWELLPDFAKEQIYEQDEDSWRRVASLAAIIAADVASNYDLSMVMDYSEARIDDTMGDEGRLWELFGDKIEEWADERGEDYDLEELQEVALEYGLVWAHADPEVVEAGNGEVSAEVRGYENSRERLEEEVVYHDDIEVDEIYKMPEDEWDRVIEKAAELEPRVDDEGLRGEEFYKMVHSTTRWGDEIWKEPNYDAYDIALNFDWERVLEAIEDHMEWEGAAPAEEYVELPPEERIFATLDLHDGKYNVIDLLPGELKKETKKMNHCVGKVQYGYGDAIKKGKIRILSVRPAGGTDVWDRTFTLEIRLSPPDNTSSIADLVATGGIARIEQVKGKRNRVPGFAKPKYATRATTDDFNKPEEWEDMILVAHELGFDVSAVPDLLPGIRAHRALEIREQIRSNPPGPIYIDMPTTSFDKPWKE